jgi:hypothetical protein
MRGLENEINAFSDEGSAVRDALWFCDLTTTPDGEPTTFAERVAEIKERYGPENMVTSFITEAAGDLSAAIARTERRVAHSLRSQST